MVCNAPAYRRVPQFGNSGVSRTFWLIVESVSYAESMWVVVPIPPAGTNDF